jgi:hypothetical protein
VYSVAPVRTGRVSRKTRMMLECLTARLRPR